MLPTICSCDTYLLWSPTLGLISAYFTSNKLHQSPSQVQNLISQSQTPPNHYMHSTDIPSCPSFSMSVFSPLSHPPLPPLIHCAITQEVWSSWKQASEHGKGQGQGGRYVRGEQRMFLSLLCPSGCCRPRCGPSWGSRAHVTLAGPCTHTCCLAGPTWRSNYTHVKPHYSSNHKTFDKRGKSEYRMAWCAFHSHRGGSVFCQLSTLNFLHTLNCQATCRCGNTGVSIDPNWLIYNITKCTNDYSTVCSWKTLQH